MKVYFWVESNKHNVTIFEEKNYLLDLCWFWRNYFFNRLKYQRIYKALAIILLMHTFLISTWISSPLNVVLMIECLPGVESVHLPRLRIIYSHQKSSSYLNLLSLYIFLSLSFSLFFSFYLCFYLCSIDLSLLRIRNQEYSL